jgi:hypothetical protein
MCGSAGSGDAARLVLCEGYWRGVMAGFLVYECVKDLIREDG